MLLWQLTYILKFCSSECLSLLTTLVFQALNKMSLGGVKSQMDRAEKREREGRGEWVVEGLLSKCGQSRTVPPVKSYSPSVMRC